MTRKKRGTQGKSKQYPIKAHSGAKCSDNEAPQQNMAVKGDRTCLSQNSAKHEDSAAILSFSVSCPDEKLSFRDVYTRIQNAFKSELMKMHLPEKEIMEICYQPAQNKTVIAKFRTERGKAWNYILKRATVQCFYTCMSPDSDFQTRIF